LVVKEEAVKEVAVEPSEVEVEVVLTSFTLA